MGKYPFDTQICNGTIESDANENVFVKLVPKNLSYEGPVDLMTYVLNEQVSLINDASIIIS